MQLAHICPTMSYIHLVYFISLLNTEHLSREENGRRSWCLANVVEDLQVRLLCTVALGCWSGVRSGQLAFFQLGRPHLHILATSAITGRPYTL